MTSSILPTKIAAIALAALALAAPAASARSADESAATGAQQKQDFRNPDNRAETSSSAANVWPKQDLRSPDARDAARPEPTPALPGPPTWPVNPQPITPVSETAHDGGGGIDTAPLLGLITGGIVLIGGAGAVAMKTRRTRTSLTG